MSHLSESFLRCTGRFEIKLWDPQFGSYLQHIHNRKALIALGVGHSGLEHDLLKSNKASVINVEMYSVPSNGWWGHESIAREWRGIVRED